MGLDWQFYHWHLEPSSKCALRCPRCPRVEHPDTPWINKDMTLTMVKQFLTPERLVNDVKRVTMCGDVGDPIYCKEYLEICSYIKTTNPKIHIFTITNGSYKKTEWWREFASILNERDTINFSIDGFDQESNNIYRVNSDFNSIVNGIKTIRDYNKSVFVNWATIAFSFNEQHLTDMQTYAKSLGCDGFQITKSTKFGSKYGAWGGVNDSLEPSQQWVSSSHRYERELVNLSGRDQNISEYISYNTMRYYKVKEKYNNSPIIPLCEIGNRGIYVNAAGYVYPCSWVSFPYDSLSFGDKTINYSDSFFAKNFNKFNIHNRTFNDIISDPSWSKCSNNFANKDKSWVECLQKCSVNNVDKNYAVGWLTN